MVSPNLSGQETTRQEAEAAEAEAERLRKQEAVITEGSAALDAEADTLRLMAELRAATSGELKSAEGIEAMRAVLRRLFVSFTLHKADAAPANDEAIETGDYLITSEARPEALYPLPKNWQPILRRVPLEIAENNLNVGLPT